MTASPAEATLRRTAGAATLWSLGVGYVISGDYFGWNFGLREGLPAMLAATAIMAAMYVALCSCIAELACATPVAGGPFAFARRAFGPAGGFFTGLVVALEYTIAPAVIAAGLAGYAEGWLAAIVPEHAAALASWTPVVAYASCIAINLAGAAVSLRALFVVTALAAATLVAWAIAVALALPDDAWSRLLAQPGAPLSTRRIAAALPAAGWFFLAIEGVPMAAEESRDPVRDLPRGMLAAMATLAVFAAMVALLGPLATGVAPLAESGNPLPAAIEVGYGRGVWFTIVTAVGSVGLFASMLSIVYAYSRQIFALARAGHLPPWLARTTARQVPAAALVVPGLVGLLALTVTGWLAPDGVAPADLLMQVAVFAALASYLAIAASFWRLRGQAPTLPRPYRTPGGRVTAAAVIVLAAVALLGAGLFGVAAGHALMTLLAVLAAGGVYFVLVVRPRIAGHTLAQELAIIAAAEHGAAAADDDATS